MSISALSDSSKSEDPVFWESDLEQIIQPLLLRSYDSEKNELRAAIREAYETTRPDRIDSSPQEMQFLWLQITLVNLFARKESLWIHPRTESGNRVPGDILIQAYCMWTKARRIARKRSVDPAAAAGALERAIHSVTDKLADNTDRQAIIRDMRKYLFKAFCREIRAIEFKQGVNRTIHLDSLTSMKASGLSDHGSHARMMDRSIFYQELLNTLDPDTKIIAHARLSLAYAWDEMPEHVKLSSKTAHNRLNKAIREAFGLRMRELQFRGCNKSSRARTA